MIQEARDAQNELDPRAELKLSLDDSLYEGDLSPMSWWKVGCQLTLKNLRELDLG